MKDIEFLFDAPEAASAATKQDLWSSDEAVKNWLIHIFDVILTVPDVKNSKVVVEGYAFRLDGKNLFTSSLLSLFDLRPRDAMISKQDFERVFCDACLDYLTPSEGEQEHFASWVASELILWAENDELLDEVSPTSIHFYLQAKGNSGALLSRLGMKYRVDFTILFVSLIHTIHIGELWPQLYDRLEVRRWSKLKSAFKLIELILNSFAAPQIRFKVASSASVKEALQASVKDQMHPDLDISEERVLRALRLKPPMRKRSIVLSAGSAVIHSGTRALGALMPERQSEKHRSKRVIGVEHTELLKKVG